MLRIILTTLYTFRIKQKLFLLGRWKLKYDEQHVNTCILWANQDNCGCSGNIELPKSDEKLEDDFYLPYII